MPEDQEEMLQQAGQRLQVEDQQHDVQFMPPQPQQMEQQQNEPIQVPPIVVQAQQIDEVVPNQEIDAQELKSAKEAYREIRAGQNMGLKARMRHTDRTERKKRTRARMLTDGMARYEAQDQALRQAYSPEHHPEMAGREALADAVITWMAHADDPAVQAENVRRFDAAMNTPEEEVRRIFDEFLAWDMKQLKVPTDEDLAKNYGRLHDLAEKGKKIENLIEYADAHHIRISASNRCNLRARADVCREIAEALERKRTLMNNPYYALLHASDVAPLTPDMLADRANAAMQRGDVRMQEYLTAVRAEKLRKQQGDVLKAPEAEVQTRFLVRREEMRAQREEEKRRRHEAAQAIVDAYDALDTVQRVRMMREMCFKDLHGDSPMSEREGDAYQVILKEKIDDAFIEEMFRQQIEASLALLGLKDALDQQPDAQMSSEERRYRAAYSIQTFQLNIFSQLVAQISMAVEAHAAKIEQLAVEMTDEHRQILAHAREVAESDNNYSKEWAKTHEELARQIREEAEHAASEHIRAQGDFAEQHGANAAGPEQ